MEEKEYTKYEKTRIIAARALQLAQGAPPLVKISKKDIKPVEIAEIEWEKGIIPIEIKKNNFLLEKEKLNENKK